MEKYTYQCTYSANSTNEIIVPKGNSTNLPTGNICSSIVTRKKMKKDHIRGTVPQLQHEFDIHYLGLF